MSFVLEDEPSLDDLRRALKAKEAECDQLAAALRSAARQRDALAHRLQTHPSQRRVVHGSANGEEIDIFFSSPRRSASGNLPATTSQPPATSRSCTSTPAALEGAEAAVTVPTVLQQRSRTADTTKRKAGIRTLERLSADEGAALHSRKLRAFDEPPFR